MKKIFLAVIIGTLVGCTDYLDKYQDDFEDKIVAEESGNEISSSSESDALSSANVESSSSAKSSSNANDKSSSSVAASSSSEEPASSSEGCTGTVIFDSEWSVSTGNKNHRPLNGKDYKSYYDITNWEGICLEYKSDTELNLSITRTSNPEKLIYTSKVTLTFPVQSTQGIKKIFWTNSDKSQSVQQAILTASNTIQSELSKGSTGNAIIYKATAISNEPLPEPTDFFKVATESDTLKWKVDDQPRSSDSSGSSECIKITSTTLQKYNEVSCPTGWSLPSEQDFYNFAMAIDSVKTLDTLDFTYSILAKDNPIALQVYRNSATAIDPGAYAFWTSNKNIIVIRSNDDITGSGNRYIMKSSTLDDSCVSANVRCIKKDN